MYHCIYYWENVRIHGRWLTYMQRSHKARSCLAMQSSGQAEKKWQSKSWEITMSVSVHECDWSCQHSSVGNLKCRRTLRPFLPVLRVLRLVKHWVTYVRTYICSASPKPSAQIASTQAMLPRIPMHISCSKYNRAELTLNTEVLPISISTR